MKNCFKNFCFLDLYCPNEIEDIDGVDDGDLYLKENKLSLAPEYISFLDEQKNYHKNNGL